MKWQRKVLLIPDESRYWPARPIPAPIDTKLIENPTARRPVNEGNAVIESPSQWQWPGDTMIEGPMTGQYWRDWSNDYDLVNWFNDERKRTVKTNENWLKTMIVTAMTMASYESPVMWMKKQYDDNGQIYIPTQWRYQWNWLWIWRPVTASIIILVLLILTWQCNDNDVADRTMKAGPEESYYYYCRMEMIDEMTKGPACVKRWYIIDMTSKMTQCDNNNGNGWWPVMRIAGDCIVTIDHYWCDIIISIVIIIVIDPVVTLWRKLYWSADWEVIIDYWNCVKRKMTHYWQWLTLLYCCYCWRYYLLLLFC